MNQVKCQIVQLSTKKPFSLVREKSNIALHNGVYRATRPPVGYIPDLMNNTDWKFVEKNWINFQFLYFINDETITTGDWAYNFTTGEITHIEYIDYDRFFSKLWRKIIASTDPKLGLPRPSEGFLKAYCKSKIQIGSVMVEYTTSEICCRGSVINSECRDECKNIQSISKLKVAPDGTITIKEVKSTWTREELDFKFNKLLNDALVSKNRIQNPDSNKIAEFITNWVNENM